MIYRLYKERAQRTAWRIGLVCALLLALLIPAGCDTHDIRARYVAPTFAEAGPGERPILVMQPFDNCGVVPFGVLQQLLLSELRSSRPQYRFDPAVAVFLPGAPRKIQAEQSQQAEDSERSEMERRIAELPDGDQILREMREREGATPGSCENAHRIPEASQKLDPAYARRLDEQHTEDVYMAMTWLREDRRYSTTRTEFVQTEEQPARTETVEVTDRHRRFVADFAIYDLRTGDAVLRFTFDDEQTDFGDVDTDSSCSDAIGDCLFNSCVNIYCDDREAATCNRALCVSQGYEQDPQWWFARTAARELP